jgi:hypothetical protein
MGQFRELQHNRRIRIVKCMCRYLSLSAGLALFMQLAHAQSTFDVNIGFGAVQDKASATGIDQQTYLSCTPSVTNSTCSATPSLNGFMLGVGGRVMLWKHIGVGGEANFQPSKQTYAQLQQGISSIGQPQIDLNSRVTFWDFNGIYQPVSTKKAGLQIEGGIGGVNMKFYENATGSNALVGSYNSSQYAASSNHFQVHAGVGVQIYVSGNFFVRPQFDIHYVPNFVQFGRNLVTEETVWVGYSFGER